MKYPITYESRTILADMLTPVNIYLKLRDVFAGAILLESSDYHGHENSLSFICCNPIASIRVAQGQIKCRFPDNSYYVEEAKQERVLSALGEFLQSFELTNPDTPYTTGLFGYLTYDAVRFLEDIRIGLTNPLVPDLFYSLYSIVIVVDHFTNALTIMEAGTPGGEERQMDRVTGILKSCPVLTFPFRLVGPEKSFMTDQDYTALVETGRDHCLRGDVFQVVLSRRFSQSFRGDEFNVYRALRSINPSPYLFYFDYGSFKLFGSSPEAQLQVKGDRASIFPIAGTFRRTGDDEKDRLSAEQLAADEKENAEHVMLVDLARNDLSRKADKVAVETFREVQYYSHVIHLVSKVTGAVRNDATILELLAATFPAGTLSGAPKHRAMQIISQYEPFNRSFYGGAIGFLGFNNEFNHAIMIRTFLSRKQELISQAGAGIVAKSDPATELAEVMNKLAALRRAMVLAEEIGKP